MLAFFSDNKSYNIGTLLTIKLILYELKEPKVIQRQSWDLNTELFF